MKCHTITYVRMLINLSLGFFTASYPDHGRGSGRLWCFQNWLAVGGTGPRAAGHTAGRVRLAQPAAPPWRTANSSLNPCVTTASGVRCPSLGHVLPPSCTMTQREGSRSSSHCSAEQSLPPMGEGRLQGAAWKERLVARQQKRKKKKRHVNCINYFYEDSSLQILTVFRRLSLQARGIFISFSSSDLSLVFRNKKLGSLLLRWVFIVIRAVCVQRLEP